MINSFFFLPMLHSFTRRIIVFFTLNFLMLGKSHMTLLFPRFNSLLKTFSVSLFLPISQASYIMIYLGHSTQSFPSILHYNHTSPSLLSFQLFYTWCLFFIRYCTYMPWGKVEHKRSEQGDKSREKKVFGFAS